MLLLTPLLCPTPAGPPLLARASSLLLFILPFTGLLDIIKHSLLVLGSLLRDTVEGAASLAASRGEGGHVGHLGRRPFPVDENSDEVVPESLEDLGVDTLVVEDVVLEHHLLHLVVRDDLVLLHWVLLDPVQVGLEGSKEAESVPELLLVVLPSCLLGAAEGVPDALLDKPYHCRHHLGVAQLPDTEASTELGRLVPEDVVQSLMLLLLLSELVHLIVGEFFAELVWLSCLPLLKALPETSHVSLKEFDPILGLGNPDESADHLRCLVGRPRDVAENDSGLPPVHDVPVGDEDPTDGQQTLLGEVGGVLVKTLDVLGEGVE
mmetsp:Transcript_23746/g.49482  ORF Transcript_23746/g.49482 Transcript_23746/m.49482 type:complete len:321 (-) Transcript_23746:2858-3820(-)